ncbi:hypothetical protein GCM10023205_53800 [Yinghuangia aomiensis]|uniref:Uncharacterized protein n=1 Tax=Yinghuangia aomiensis TaxID=676205 RepID=A0ABP9HUP1_9ACTN
MYRYSDMVPTPSSTATDRMDNPVRPSRSVTRRAADAMAGKVRERGRGTSTRYRAGRTLHGPSPPPS